ncbi:ribbon-helix-helix domain-containing protein [Burkholderia gladioli]|uniref:ribbon-helix-helix domain-containing protein n=1 Tax=Burkholderia gladioli TaxID=28095 RepID=UPI002FE07EF6
MALTKAPKKLTTPASNSAERFINGAPDAPGQARSQEMSPNKKPITLTFDPVLLAELDATAKSMGLSRSAAFAVAVSQWLGKGR